jgi:hypothetical protein
MRAPIAPAAAVRRAVAGLAAAGLLAVLGAVLLAGCSPRKILGPNTAPETILFVQGPVDTVSLTVHLYWFGTDPDGEVTGFEVRFRNPAAPADTQWVPTTRTDSLFTVFTPSGYSAPTFEVRAIDNEGQRDPSPATEDFQFSNQAPIVDLINPPAFADTTYPSVTLTWSGLDPDGDAATLSYRVWLNGNEANARITDQRTFTVPSADFLQAGAYSTGPRTVYVQAIDAGGRAGLPDSTRWVVRAPVTGTRARLLIIDDVPTTNPANVTTDTLYYNTAARNLAANEYSILRLQTTQPFRSIADVAQTCGLFEAVIWYRGRELTVSNTMRTYRDGLGAYLEDGGTLLIESLNLVEGEGVASAALPGDWLGRYMGSDALFKHIVPGVTDSTVSWTIDAGDTLFSGVTADTLRSVALDGGLRAFVIRDPSYALLTVPIGALPPGNSVPMPVAVTVPQSSGGRLVALSYPVRLTHGLLNAHRFLAGVFQQMGLTGP